MKRFDKKSKKGRWQQSLRRLSFCLSLALLAGPAFAEHPISITQASAYVQREKATVVIDLFLEDLFLFHNLQANSNNRLEKAVIQSGIEQHKTFLLERFQVLDAESNPLKGHVVDVKSFEMPADGVPLGDLMSYSLTYTFEYPIETPPKFLTFVQRLVDPSLGIPAEMTLRVKQTGATGDRVWSITSGKPEVVDFDWDLPPPGDEASKAEWEAWMEKKREAALGITSYSSVYSFLYIEDGEVRHEILIPLLTLEASVLIPRDDDSMVDLEEQADAKEQIGAFFSAVNPITIDQVEIVPEVMRIDFYGLNFVDFAKQAEAKPVGLASARVGVILRYACSKPPTEMDLSWDFFNPFIFSVQGMVYTDDDVQRMVFSSEAAAEARFKWRRSKAWLPPNIQPLPVFSDSKQGTLISINGAGIGLLGLLAIASLVVAVIGVRLRSTEFMAVGFSILPVILVIFATSGLRQKTQAKDRDPQLATAVFGGLHKNLYEAFRYRQEEPLYDALAVSVDGPLLRRLYLQIRESLVIAEQGGAVSRIHEVNVESIEQLPPPEDSNAIRVKSRWNVRGTVEHWGHIHGRTNAFEGIFTMAPRQGHWKLTEVALLHEEQTAVVTQLRGMTKQKENKSP